MVGYVLLCFVWGLFISLLSWSVSTAFPSPINRCMNGLSYEAFFCAKFQRHTELLHIGVIGLYLLLWILGCRMFSKYACSKLMFYQLYSTGKLQILPYLTQSSCLLEFLEFWSPLWCFVWMGLQGSSWYEEMSQLSWSVWACKNQAALPYGLFVDKNSSFIPMSNTITPCLYMTNSHLVTYWQFWASGQCLHSEINPQGSHNGVFNSTLIKYKQEVFKKIFTKLNFFSPL